jgi:hypothetical protein
LPTHVNVSGSLDPKESAMIEPGLPPRDDRQETPIAVGRRETILAFAGLCAGVLSGASSGLAAACPDADALSAWLRSEGASVFSDVVALRRLGSLYLDAHPEERSRQRLSGLLIGGRDGPIRERLLRATAQDWANHRVAVVDGWLLARSEARLCALLHLQERVRA